MGQPVTESRRTETDAASTTSEASSGKHAALSLRCSMGPACRIRRSAACADEACRSAEAHAQNASSAEPDRPTQADADAERIQKALACPCLDDLRGGPCWNSLADGFTCFLQSKEEEQVRRIRVIIIGLYRRISYAAALWCTLSSLTGLLVVQKLSHEVTTRHPQAQE